MNGNSFSRTLKNVSMYFLLFRKWLVSICRSINIFFFYLRFIGKLRARARLKRRGEGGSKFKLDDKRWRFFSRNGNSSPPTRGSGRETCFKHAYVPFNGEDPMRLIAFKRLKVCARGDRLKRLGMWVSEYLCNCRDN